MSAINHQYYYYTKSHHATSKLIQLVNNRINEKAVATDMPVDLEI